MAQLSALQTRVKYNIGGRSDKDAVITEALNQSVIDASVLFDWPDLKTTDSTKTISAGEYSVAMPTTMRKLDEEIRLKDASNNYYTVKILGKATFKEIYYEDVPSVTGQPTHFYMENRTIYFDRKVDVNYTLYIDGYKYPTDMSASGDSPSISGIDDILVAQATGYVYASLKQIDMASFWFMTATNKINQRVDEVRPSEVGQIEPY